jgi:hypothetical protein
MESLEFGRVATAGRRSRAKDTCTNGATGHVVIVGDNSNFIGVGVSETVESVPAKMMGGTVKAGGSYFSGGC